MIPWSLLDTATVPGGSETLRLKQRGAEFSIMLGNNELMNSRLSGSEEALATMVCEKLRAARQAPKLLIGGLGMGFTLRAALAALPADAGIVVAELVPAVVKWAHGPMAAIFGGSLTDPRVTIRETDVGNLIRNRPAFDAILLDVDNGPEGLTRNSNDALYTSAGLNAAHAALTDGGMLAVWSATPSPAFLQRLRKTGFDVDEVKVRANGSRGGARHIIWIATRST